MVQERKVAVDSLMAVAGQLHSAHHALADKLTSRSDLQEHHTLDAFFQTVKAAADVQVPHRDACPDVTSAVFECFTLAACLNSRAVPQRCMVCLASLHVPMCCVPYLACYLRTLGSEHCRRSYASCLSC